MKPSSTVHQLRAMVEEGLKSLSFPPVPADLYNPIKYMLSLEAKRMRPVLMLSAAEMFEGDAASALMASLGIEVFHNFTLLHDDIMDNAPLRRSMQTVHAKWNANVAILSGDTMFVKSCQLMMMVPDSVMRPVLELFHQTAIEVCEGQQLDMDFESRSDVQVDEYIHMITYKTAVLLAAALKTGAIIAGASEECAEHLYEFGRATGIAFQLQDDILDVFGDQQKFGKLQGGDIIANKKTFLWIRAHELAGASDLLELKRWASDLLADPAQKVSAVIEIYNRLGIRELAEAEMLRYFKSAMQHLALVKVPDERKTVLRDFAEQLMVREK